MKPLLTPNPKRRSKRRLALTATVYALNEQNEPYLVFTGPIRARWDGKKISTRKPAVFMPMDSTVIGRVVMTDRTGQITKTVDYLKDRDECDRLRQPINMQCGDTLTLAYRAEVTHT